MINEHLITKKGLEKIKERLIELERKFKEILAQKGEAAETGGNVWHDNPSFEGLIEQERMIVAQIDELKSMLINSKVVDEDVNKKVVDIGSVVTLLFNDEQKIEYKITDSQLSDPSKNLISYSSPVGCAILGARCGESREFVVGNKKKKIKILEIK